LDSASFQEIDINFKVIPKNEVDFSQENTLFFDLTKCLFPLLIRTWEAADKMQPLGLSGHKKISDILCGTDFTVGIQTNALLIDEKFLGGGMHETPNGGFLDMHADFNYHPLNDKWFRNLNLLLYINKDWKKEHGGELKLEHADTGIKTEVDVPFNRLAIMLCRGYTLHGYDAIRFPEGKYRTSIAAYAYTLHDKPLEDSRTTVWHVEKSNPIKYILSKIWVPAVKLKSIFSKSKTADH
jgi:hypothetical protein